MRHFTHQLTHYPCVNPGDALTPHRQVIFSVKTGVVNFALKWEAGLINTLCATVFPLTLQRLLQMVETYPPLMYGRSIIEYVNQRISMKEIF